MNKQQFSAMVSGAFVFWDAGTTQHDEILRRLSDIGLGQFCPSRRSHNDALARAMTDIGKAHAATLPKRVDDQKVEYRVNIQPRLSQDKHGLECQIVGRKAGPNEYETLFTAKVTPLTGTVEVIDGWASLTDLQTKYDMYRKECSGSQVGQSLVEILKHYYATCVRAAGGLYYLPEDATDDWDHVCEAFEKSSKENVIHMAKIVMDERAARSVRSAIVDELFGESCKIADEIANNEYTEKGLETRRGRVAALRSKCNRYKSILSDTLTEVETALGTAEKCLNIVQATEEANNDEVFDVV